MLHSISHFYNAFKNSWKGLKSAWHCEWALRFEMVLLLISIPAAFYLGKSAAEYVLLISSVFFLLVLELVNTAIEKTVDRIGYEYNELSGLAKDLASASIFLGGINTLITWGIIFVINVGAKYWV